MRKVLLKFRVSRVIPTFHSCRSKNSYSLPTNPNPLFLHHSSTSTSTPHKLTHPPSPLPKPHPSSFKRHVSSALSSARHACLRPPSSPPPSHTQSSSPKTKTKHHFFKWIRPKYPQWHIITHKLPPHDHTYDSTPPRRKIYNSAASDTSDHENDVVLLPPISKHRVSKRRSHRSTKRRTTTFKNKIRISTSSDSAAGIFSDDDDQTETLVSTDSTSPVKSKERETRRKQHNKRRPSCESSGNASPTAPARLSEFMRKMAPCRAVVDGKVRESFAVVKKSEDPYEDFKTSMAEMVVEKQMFEEKELEELLRCFLSLNSERHHEAIVRAFTEIWKGLFCHSLSST